VIDTSESNPEPSRTRIAAINALAVTLNRDVRFDVECLHLDDLVAKAVNDDILWIHWVLDDEKSASSPYLPEKTISILFKPFLQLIGSPAITIGYRNHHAQQRSIDQFSHSLFAKKSILIGELDDISFHPLPQRYDKFFARKKGKVILLSHTTRGCTKPTRTMIRNFLIGGHTVLMPADIKMLREYRKIKGQELKILPSNIPEYIQIGILHRVDLVIGTQNSMTRTAALMGTPYLPYPGNELASLSFPQSIMDKLEHGMLSRDLMDFALLCSQRLVSTLLSALPLNSGRETEIETFLTRVLPLGNPDNGNLSSLGWLRKIPLNHSKPSKQFSLLPYFNEHDEPTHKPISPTAHHYRLQQDRLTRKLRKLRNDPETFLCDSKGMLASWLCKSFTKR
jgi:hypothetical protein